MCLLPFVCDILTRIPGITGVFFDVPGQAQFPRLPEKLLRLFRFTRVLCSASGEPPVIWPETISPETISSHRIFRQCQGHSTSSNSNLIDNCLRALLTFIILLHRHPHISSGELIVLHGHRMVVVCVHMMHMMGMVRCMRRRREGDCVRRCSELDGLNRRPPIAPRYIDDYDSNEDYHNFSWFRVCRKAVKTTHLPQSQGLL
ncbi:hypothetical protein C8R45DRAFT_14446 [Mycena sanguinolenta]|nr:hypothetical protein C8R45DRAFT_14446 [Mycena sanguinolenta]